MIQIANLIKKYPQVLGINLHKKYNPTPITIVLIQHKRYLNQYCTNPFFNTFRNNKYGSRQKTVLKLLIIVPKNIPTRPRNLTNTIDANKLITASRSGLQKSFANNPVALINEPVIFLFIVIKLLTQSVKTTVCVRTISCPCQTVIKGFKSAKRQTAQKDEIQKFANSKLK